MNTTAKDINIYFPKNKSSNVVRVFIKEAMAMIFNLTDIQLIEKLYRDLSIILNSKYVTDEVLSAVNNIVLMGKDTDINGHRTDTSKSDNVKSTASNVNNAGQSSENDEIVQNEEILEYDEDEDDTMYKQSIFYKRFQLLTFQGNYDNTEKTQLNNSLD